MKKEKQEKNIEDESETKEAFSLVEVPTQTGVFVRDNKANKVLDTNATMVLILNKLDKIERAI